MFEDAEDSCYRSYEKLYAQCLKKGGIHRWGCNKFDFSSDCPKKVGKYQFEETLEFATKRFDRHL